VLVAAGVVPAVDPLPPQEAKIIEKIKMYKYFITLLNY